MARSRQPLLLPCPQRRDCHCDYSYYFRHKTGPSGRGALKPPPAWGVLRAPASGSGERNEPGRSLRAAGQGAVTCPQLPSSPHPTPGPFHCGGGGAGRARGGAEMVAPGAAPACRRRRRRALLQDGAGQAAALAVRGKGGPGGRPGRRLGPRGAARAQPAAAGPRRGLRGQRRGPEVGAEARARGPRAPPRGGLCMSAACILHGLRWAASAALPAAPGGGGTAGVSSPNPNASALTTRSVSSLPWGPGGFSARSCS